MWVGAFLFTHITDPTNRRRKYLLLEWFQSLRKRDINRVKILTESVFMAISGSSKLQSGMLCHYGDPVNIVPSTGDHFRRHTTCTHVSVIA